MVHVTDISVGFMALSAAISLALLAFAVNAYRRSREPAMAFVAGAFTLFAMKSSFVAFSIATDLVEHDLLEMLDAVGDLATVLLFVMPIFWPPK